VQPGGKFAKRHLKPRDDPAEAQSVLSEKRKRMPSIKGKAHLKGRMLMGLAWQQGPRPGTDIVLDT
jgi:hypothetical protein